MLTYGSFTMKTTTLRAQMIVDPEAAKRRIRQALRQNQASDKMVQDAANALNVSYSTLYRIIRTDKELMAFLEERKGA
jgi:hypothetical protein